MGFQHRPRGRSEKPCPGSHRLALDLQHYAGRYDGRENVHHASRGLGALRDLESNRSIRMENIGAAKVMNPWLTIGPIDFFSQQTIANSVVEGLSTEREMALALYYFYITHRYHKGNGDNAAQGDVSQAINVFGFNTCGNSTLCLSDLLDKVGDARLHFQPLPGPCRPAGFLRRKVQHAGRGHGDLHAPAGQPHRSPTSWTWSGTTT